VSPVKTDEPIEMLLGVWTRVGPSNHVVRGARIPVHGKGHISGL